MHLVEWPLILFTLMIQMSAGAFMFLGILREVKFMKLDEGVFSVAGRPILNVTGFILLLSVIIAAFHLGSPLNAFNALNNLESSWLSREILSLILFLFSGTIFLIYFMKKGTGGKIIFILALITVLLGYITIASMSLVYMLETVPVWNNFFTPLSFVMTSLILGSGAIIHAINIVMNKEKYFSRLKEFQSGNLADTFSKISKFILILLSIQLIIIIYQPVYLSSGASNDSFDLLINDNIFLLLFRILFIIAAIVWLLLILKKNRMDGNVLIRKRYYAFYFGILLIQELIGRYIFYAIYSRIGV